MRVRDEDAYIGLDTRFFVEQLYNRGKVNIVLNRKAWLEREAKKKRDQFYDTAAIGDVYRGTVKTFTSFGAFVDLGGFDGLLHVNDMRWGHVASPKDAVVIGEEVNVKVIRIDREAQKVNLSLKHFYARSVDHLRGAVLARRSGYRQGDEDHRFWRIHRDRTRYRGAVAHLRHVVGEEDRASARDSRQRRRGAGEDSCLRPGARQAVARPQARPAEPLGYRGGALPAGQVVKGVVRNITSYGAFVQLEEGIDGLLHVDDMSWTKKVRNPASVVQTDRNSRSPWWTSTRRHAVFAWA